MKFIAFLRLTLAVIAIAGAELRAIPEPTRADPTTAADDRKVLTVGVAVDAYPMSYSENGHVTGFSTDALDALARVMHWKIERVGVPDADLIRRFQNGQFDILQTSTHSSTVPISAEFSDPYLVLRGTIFSRKDFPDIRTLSDLRGATLAIIGQNSIMEQLLRDHAITPKSLLHCSTMEEALHLMENGDVDAVYASRAIAFSIITRDNLNNIRALSIVPDGYERRHVYAVHKGDPESLLPKLNQGISLLRREGELNRIYKKWFGRFDSTGMTGEQVIRYTAPLLALALAICIFALLRQRGLRHRLASQAAQLTENEALLAEAQRIARVGHWRYEVEVRKISCSSEMLRILDRSSEKTTISYIRLLSLVSRADRAAAHRAIIATLHDGVPLELRVSIYPRRDLRKIVQIRAQAVRDAGGVLTGIVGTMQDITQEKIFEEDLRTREQLLRAIYDNVPSGLGVVEVAGDSFRFISANPGMAKLLGLEETFALAGKSLAHLDLKPDVLTFWLHWFHRGVSRSEILKSEPSLGHGKKHLSLTFIPLGTGQNGQAQLCFLIEDVSERKQMDAEVSQGRRLRAVGELVGGIAHEFNNLLTPILLKAELLSTEWQTDLRLREELASISRAAQRGADLTRRLLAFGRRSDPEFAEVKLHAIVKANIDLLRPTIDRRIELLSDVAEDLPSLYLNPGDLHQVVMNLLLNARDTLMDRMAKNSDDSWRACIRTEAASFGPHAIESTHWEKPESPAGWLCLTIRDNGMGMQQHVLERIFEPFYTTKEVGKGTGLGLATVWHLVTRIGGKIDVQSQVGEGTEFKIWLPVLPVPKNATPARPETRNPMGIVTGVRICLVEDDDLVAHTVATALRRQQHNVTHFRNGSEAWRHLSMHASSYDLLLLDLDLPGINGMEIARRIRSLRYRGKILVASGRLADSDTREFEKIGVDAHLEKPFSPQKLQAAIQGCMNNTKPSSVLSA